VADPITPREATGVTHKSIGPYPVDAAPGFSPSFGVSGIVIGALPAPQIQRRALADPRRALLRRAC